ncbi:hypothetical protein LUX01_00525 [Streptomyces sudanensis]|uniref:hypothetical protein n=1 Tax=Streptomyces sudanensis TaxID=436397 RepID=UPI0020CE288E|nr:hypothetical protein [Streptomyces sudanensis]MCP9985403.1 hypothetical protein [Streptomyces sudanensis]
MARRIHTTSPPLPFGAVSRSTPVKSAAVRMPRAARSLIKPVPRPFSSLADRWARRSALSMNCCLRRRSSRASESCRPSSSARNSAATACCSRCLSRSAPASAA